MEVNYDLCCGDMEYRLAVFDWNCASNYNRFAFVEDNAQPIGGVLRVYVEPCAAIGMDKVDQLVLFEIELAKGRGTISEDVAECVWQGWRSDGEEKMEYIMEMGESPVR
jgi:hypothetical protein